MDYTAILVVAISIVSVGVASLSLLILKELYSSGEASMVSFQLNPQETKYNFRLLLYAHIIAFVGMFALGVGTYFGLKVFVDVVRLVLLFYAITVGIVFYRWWRQFS